eukprot:comp22129_c0_seq1/m.51662 comp22129_c0_seq1/g.51662  ORF comp22129_c0_seq1/g.51662 comp22129_c0_seq1/m.51662 type:complete len:387 (-) comp22129_c0_seq1:741-1901(-)
MVYCQLGIDERCEPAPAQRQRRPLRTHREPGNALVCRSNNAVRGHRAVRNHLGRIHGNKGRRRRIRGLHPDQLATHTQRILGNHLGRRHRGQRNKENIHGRSHGCRGQQRHHPECPRCHRRRKRPHALPGIRSRRQQLHGRGAGRHHFRDGDTNRRIERGAISHRQQRSSGLGRRLGRNHGQHRSSNNHHGPGHIADRHSRHPIHDFRDRDQSRRIIDPDAIGDPNARGNSNTVGHTNTIGDTNTNSRHDCNSNPDSERKRWRDPGALEWRHPCAIRRGHCNRNPDGWSNCNRNPDGRSHGHRDPDGWGHGHCNPDGRGNCSSDPGSCGADHQHDRDHGDTDQLSANKHQSHGRDCTGHIGRHRVDHNHHNHPARSRIDGACLDCD